MAEITKHVGQVINTGKRCVIVFLQIPDKEDHTLIVDAEALPDRVHDPLMNIIRSNEAQQANNLGEVLNRRLMPDTNKTILNELHEGGWMRAESITNVHLVPRPNSRIVLADMLKALGKIPNDPVAPLNTNPVDQIASQERGIYGDNLRSDTLESNMKIAEGLLAQAKLLDDDANILREKAFKLAPNLRPTMRVSLKSEAAPEVTEIAQISEVKSSDSKETTAPKRNTRRKSASA